MNANLSPVVWNPELIQRYDLAGPRYTSYPTAPQFHESFNEIALLNAISRSNQKANPLSLYFHIPFCESLCYYCGCNKIVTPNKERAAPYLERVFKEIEMQAGLFDSSRVVKQLHWGGGTPTYISDEEMTQLMEATRKHFHILDNDQAEISIEIHPGHVSTTTISHLRKLGFNRISMGIQDFDPSVQKAVNRFNTPEEVKTLVDKIREEKFHSISMDLIYGLPLQNLDTFSITLEKVIELSPDRLSLFNYAHLPHLFKSQALIRDEDLPSGETKLALLHYAIDRLQAAGYVYIGMDHFAKPEDELVKAQEQGKLQRNFQGYATHGDCDLIAFGVSSISSIDNVYVQNAKNINDYLEKIDSGVLPYIKGFTLNKEDELRKYIINQLICHFELSFKSVKDAFDVDVQHHFALELQELAPMIEDGLLEITCEGIRVHNAGRMLIRRVCMVFDEYLNKGNLIRFSKII